MLDDRREEQKIIEVMQALILAPSGSPESGLSHLLDHFRVKSFPNWNSMLSDTQLQSAVDFPHFPTADARSRRLNPLGTEE